MVGLNSSTEVRYEEQESLLKYQATDDSLTVQVASKQTIVVDDYDANNAQQEEQDLISSESDRNAGYLSSIFNLCNDILGAGFIALPYYVASIGVLMTPVVMIFFAIITVYTLNTVYYLSSKYRKPNYPDLCRYSLGIPGYILVCVLIFIFNFGGFVAQLQIMGENLPRMLKAFTEIETVWFGRTWVLIFVMVAFLPLSFWTKISSYTINSVLSILTLIFLSFLLLYECVFHRNAYPMPQDALDITFNSDFVAALGGMSYLFVCHDLSFSVFGTLRNPTRKRWSNVNLSSIFLVVIIFTVTGMSGFFMFYNDSQANILNNFAYNSILANIGRTLISLNIIISVPYNVFMPRLAIQSILSLSFKSVNDHPKTFNVICTVFVMGLALLISELVTDLGATFELVGAIAAISIAFILPAIIYLKLESRKWWTGGMLSHIFILIFGVLAMISSTYSILSNLM